MTQLLSVLDNMTLFPCGYVTRPPFRDIDQCSFSSYQGTPVVSLGVILKLRNYQTPTLGWVPAIAIYYISEVWYWTSRRKSITIYYICTGPTLGWVSDNYVISE